ncbi:MULTISPECIES: hypothetical protein [Sulfurospirillum]|uniref:hypothetical protein n=1 Tax=Sulfurospirillum TaxID=57665 RepID=UPI000694C4FE|nr:MULTISPECIES: hypothetical protein [Sulfurospirillum]
MKVFLLILTIVLLSGCASSTPSDFKIFESKKNEFIKNEESKSYILGKRQSCYVGDKIINKFSYKKHIKETINSDNQQVESLIDFKALNKGQLYSLSGQSKSLANEYYIFIYNDSGWYRYIKADLEGYIRSAHLFDSSGKIVEENYIQTYLGQKVFQKHDLKSSSNVEETFLKGSFELMLLYNGKSNNDIKIQYREFKDDMARAAFYQDLTYNLDESKIIRFKNFKIEILKASNERLDFIVLEE